MFRVVPLSLIGIHFVGLPTVGALVNVAVEEAALFVKLPFVVSKVPPGNVIPVMQLNVVLEKVAVCVPPMTTKTLPFEAPPKPEVCPLYGMIVGTVPLAVVSAN